MNINEVASLTGLSVRTLHHYDRIGLLIPKRNRENGYREYSDEDLNRLQQILFFKECGFPLSVIREMLENPGYNQEQAFEIQKQYLMHERKRIDTMLNTLLKTHQTWKGEITMTPKEKFEGFDLSKNPYKEEAKHRWGEEAVEKSSQTIAVLGKEGQEALSEQMNELFRTLAEVRHLPPDSPEVMEQMDVYYHFLNDNFGYHYSPEAFAGLGQLYVNDTRFTDNIDRFGEGLSLFLSQAMEHYFAKQKKTN
ncbi:MerR family transcriptional regulator [Clostridium merdae]|uniref:MerR family transcriptional regulator n=1 Tax=Clostridium merdae TaxID=1958780 RepID=UPI000A267709|nr:MerR family transcriptional regulator [Clostridium merdae]